MIRCILTGSLAFLLTSTSVAEDLLERAAESGLHTSRGNTVSRVVRDDEGNGTRLRLNNFKLVPSDIAEIVAQEHLRSLVLFGTNISNRDVSKLVNCESLEHLNLTNTEITDVAITSILQMKKLNSLCIGNVRVTAEAVEKLKVENRTRGKAHVPYLRWGYSERKQESKK